MPLQLPQSPRNGSPGQAETGSGTGPSASLRPQRSESRQLAKVALSPLCAASQYPDGALRFADEGAVASLLSPLEDAGRLKNLGELHRLSMRLLEGRRINDAIVVPVEALPQSLQSLLEGAVIEHEGRAMTLFEFIRREAKIEAVVFTRVLSSPVAQLPGAEGDFAAAVSIGGATYVPYEQLQKPLGENPLADRFLYPGKRLAFVNFGARTPGGILLASPQRESLVAARLVHEAEQMRIYDEILRGERPLEDAAHRKVDQLAYQKEFDALTAINHFLEASASDRAGVRTQVLLNDRQRERIQARLQRLN